MDTNTPDSTPASILETGTKSGLGTIKTLATEEPDACPEGGTRYIVFHKHDELEAAGILIRVGRKILIDKRRYIAWLRSGGARNIRANVQQRASRQRAKGSV